MSKTYCVILHGKSVEELENRIQEFQNDRIVWCSMSTFHIPQKYILSKINKTFDIIYDSSTVKNEIEYELTCRIPRLENFLIKNLNCKYICTKTDKNNLYQLRARIAPEFNIRFQNQIIYTEDLGINPNPFCVSLHLYIACLCKMGAKKIVLFGADGGGRWGNSIDSYYHSEEVKIDKQIAGNLSYNMVGDTANVNSSFESLMKSTLGYVPTVYNCSPESLYTVFNNISYENIKEII